MARLLTRQDDPEPGVWHALNQRQIDDWRKKARTDLATKRGTVLEINTARRQGMERVSPNTPGGDVVGVEAPRSVGVRDARDTVEIAAKDMAEWAKTDRATFMSRVRALKQMGNFPHLTDTEAADQLWDMCVSIARGDAERVYAKLGLNKPVTLQ